MSEVDDYVHAITVLEWYGPGEYECEGGVEGVECGEAGWYGCVGVEFVDWTVGTAGDVAQSLLGRQHLQIRTVHPRLTSHYLVLRRQVTAHTHTHNIVAVARQ